MRQAAGGSAAAPTGERHRNEPGRFGTALPALEAGQMSPHERLGKKGMASTEEDSKERTTIPQKGNEKAKILRLQVAR